MRKHIVVALAIVLLLGIGFLLSGRSVVTTTQATMAQSPSVSGKVAHRAALHDTQKTVYGRNCSTRPLSKPLRFIPGADVKPNPWLIVFLLRHG